jgi:hypothetical protein
MIQPDRSLEYSSNKGLRLSNFVTPQNWFKTENLQNLVLIQSDNSELNRILWSKPVFSLQRPFIGPLLILCVTKNFRVQIIIFFIKADDQPLHTTHKKSKLSFKIILLNLFLVKLLQTFNT